MSELSEIKADGICSASICNRLYPQSDGTRCKAKPPEKGYNRRILSEVQHHERIERNSRL